MSNHLAIATVTATLRDLIQGAIGTVVAGATVSNVRPSADAAGVADPGVNIFLFQAVPNTSWRNEDLPTRTGGGVSTRRPTIALDLHYLLTFHGNDTDLEPQRLLAATARVIHARPLLTADMIEATVATAGGFLLDSDLADEVERVKFTPLPFNLEELSKLWSVLLQTPYVLTMGYVASVVLIETDEAVRRPLPVRTRNVRVHPFQRARIESAQAVEGPDRPVEIGGRIVIRGSQLAGPITGIRVGVADALLPDIGTVLPDRMEVTLSDPELRAGVVGLQIVYESGSASNVAPLVLRPLIQTVAVAELTTMGNRHSATITVDLDPVLEPQQRVILYLNEFRAPPDDAAAYRFEALERASPAARADFAVSGVRTGRYLVRIEVDGAESTLLVEENEADPDFGAYVAPSITLP